MTATKNANYKLTFKALGLGERATGTLPRLFDH